jgi:hypothetical protein
VTNPTGNRPCEAALNKDFAKFQAGAHPSNTGKGEFANGTRGGGVGPAVGRGHGPPTPPPAGGGGGVPPPRPPPPPPAGTGPPRGGWPP